MAGPVVGSSIGPHLFFNIGTTVLAALVGVSLVAGDADGVASSGVLLCKGLTVTVGCALSALIVLALLVRSVFAIQRLRVHMSFIGHSSDAHLREAPDIDVAVAYAGADGAEEAKGGAGSTKNGACSWPSYAQCSLPQSGGTLHTPRTPAGSGLAILVLPGKGRIFNLFPLQRELCARGNAEVDILGLDFCAYGAGYCRNVRDRWFPRLMNEMRLSDVSDALLEALDVAGQTYKKIMVVANSTAAVAVLQQMEENEEALARASGFWLTNPVIAWKEGHAFDAIMRSPLPSWVLTFLDRVLGLGSLTVAEDPDPAWFYFQNGDRAKGLKACFEVARRTAPKECPPKPDSTVADVGSSDPQVGVMVGLPGHQQAGNPTRLMYLAELVPLCRAWEERLWTRNAQRKQYQQQKQQHLETAQSNGAGDASFDEPLQSLAPSARSPPVYFSLNDSDEEPHCGAAKARELLLDWGAKEVKGIDTHEEFCYDTLEQKAAAFAALSEVAAKVLGVKCI
eukprot:TRINITY_DN51138_c0_g1_i1.p1 TRINITY_DN51138_c0_g1~~TRINITY_DN51138_c0_g1_i1.p1  ORF type:complete len:509 (+),score=94.45 TRINITY_DN51138_c0_g1_i1:80-1606(+)